MSNVFQRYLEEAMPVPDKNTVRRRRADAAMGDKEAIKHHLNMSFTHKQAADLFPTGHPERERHLQKSLDHQDALDEIGDKLGIDSTKGLRRFAYGPNGREKSQMKRDRARRRSSSSDSDED